MNDNKRHPVWQLYDELRTARYNVLCYEFLLKRKRSQKLILEIFIAITTSSGIAGLWFFNTPDGATAWKYISAIAVFLSVINPFVLKVETITKIEQCFFHYTWYYLSLKKIYISINETHKYSEENKKSFHSLFDVEVERSKSDPCIYIRQSIRNKFQDQVNKEMPAEDFYIPEQ